ncbi:MAG TPA: carotenoid biosynthesis protein [Anaerolineae bacterium]|nr:carotenoid biosynthesis protein [Anaerolineae bacterium]
MSGAWDAFLALWVGMPSLAQVALLSWVVCTISLPIFRWFWSDRGLRWSVTIGVVAQAITVLLILGSAWGWARATFTALMILALGWTVEYLGSHTGFPFGRYHYTNRLWPQLGNVPLLIPVAWLMMLPPAWAIGQAIVAEQRLLFVGASALAFTTWDLFLDPQMVSWQLWVWDRPRGYFGIPWVNYLGWFAAAAVITAIAAPPPLPMGQLGLVYGITWILETIGLGILWRQPGPALCGFLVMGAMLLWAVLVGG